MTTSNELPERDAELSPRPVRGVRIDPVHTQCPYCLREGTTHLTANLCLGCGHWFILT